MRASLGGLVALGLMALISIDCNRDQDRKVGQTRTEPGARAPQERGEQGKPIGGGPAELKKTSPAAAVASIVVARCDRELRCNNIGPNESYKTRGECISKMQTDKSESINAKDCPKGINEGNLNICVQAIRNEACGHPLDAISRLSACKTDDICMK